MRRCSGFRRTYFYRLSPYSLRFPYLVHSHCYHRSEKGSQSASRMVAGKHPYELSFIKSATPLRGFAFFFTRSLSAPKTKDVASLQECLYVPSANAYLGTTGTAPSAHLLENGRARARRPEAGTVYWPGHFHRNEKTAAPFHYAAWHKDGATALRFASRIAPKTCQAYSVPLRRGLSSPVRADGLWPQQRARDVVVCPWHFCCEGQRPRQFRGLAPSPTAQGGKPSSFQWVAACAVQEQPYALSDGLKQRVEG